MGHKKWLFVALCLCVIAIIASLYVKNQTFARQISATEAKEKVEQLYSGEVLSTSDKDHNFLLTLALPAGEYEVVVDRDSGEILSMVKTKTTPTETNVDQGSEVKEEPSEPTSPNEGIPSQITKEEAITIALKQLPGTLEEIELEESDGVSYYSVEIEEDDQQEATIQVHSITGEIMSVTYDD
jgi:uncharacterized membrane protein YkoI